VAEEQWTSVKQVLSITGRAGVDRAVPTNKQSSRSNEKARKQPSGESNDNLYTAYRNAL
jgi:hypothetical protein